MEVFLLKIASADAFGIFNTSQESKKRRIFMKLLQKNEEYCIPNKNEAYLSYMLWSWMFKSVLLYKIGVTILSARGGR